MRTRGGSVGVVSGRAVGHAGSGATGGLAEIGTLLVEVALDGGNGERGVATHLGGGEILPGDKETCIERCAPRRQDRGEHGGVVEGNALGDRGVSGGEELGRGS